RGVPQDPEPAPRPADADAPVCERHVLRRGRCTMLVREPFNLKAWIDEHRDLLKPPVGNSMLWNDKFMVMVVGGPNQRSDFHVNPGEELFYQVEGDITLRLMINGEVSEVPIRQGDIFLLPAGIPHSPQRPANTVG